MGYKSIHSYPFGLCNQTAQLFLLSHCGLQSLGSVSSKVISTLDCWRAVLTKLHGNHVIVMWLWGQYSNELTLMEWSWLVYYSPWPLTWAQTQHHLVWTCSHMTLGCSDMHITWLHYYFLPQINLSPTALILQSITLLIDHLSSSSAVTLHHSIVVPTNEWTK